MQPIFKSLRKCMTRARRQRRHQQCRALNIENRILA